MSAERGKNLSTRINYFPGVEAVLPVMEMLPMGVISRLPVVTETPAIQAFYGQSVVEFFSGAVLSIVLHDSRRRGGDWLSRAKTGLYMLGAVQAYRFYESSGNLTQMGASLATFSVGMGSFFTLRTAARGLYDSGATIPVYRALGIQDRRIK